MGEKKFKIQINDFIHILTYIQTRNGIVEKFVVKLLVYLGNNWEEVSRYDCHHNTPHRDILKPDGSKYKITKYHLTNKQALDLALNDYKENYDLYVERYIRWKIEKKV